MASAVVPDVVDGFSPFDLSVTFPSSGADAACGATLSIAQVSQMFEGLTMVGSC